ncbi:BTAD domain-containing putative transcriptional regulator [Streptomyces sp. NPDC051907]|uniref:BTAD domain-containing putative transcriptional regulator n=1 Tax=Streptomyces sp. NPDC051907 TaxID=3155284 RepID=UPI00341216D0
MHYRVLGTSQAFHDDETPVSLGGARLRALLTVLALRAGRTVPVGVLVDEVWDGDPPADAVGAVQALVGRLRRALGHEAVASAEGGGYRLCADADDVDLHRFDRLTGEGTRALEEGDADKAAALLDDALALWRGPALADLPDRGAQTARWEARRLDARRARLGAALALGRAEEALPELAALCEEHPLDEPLHALRIRGLRDAGRAAQALEAYEAVRRELADRLGADPGAELRSLHAQLLTPVPAPAPVPARIPDPVRAPAVSSPTPAPAPGSSHTVPRPGNLRARLTSFVGREADIETIRGDLSQARLVTLLGPGGAGKTRLSQEAAEQAAHAWPDGVWLAELAPVDAPENVAEAVLTALGARETVLRGAGAEELRAAERHGDDALVRLVEHCSRRRMLLLLDNCEHVVASAATLAERLLESCPNLTILATSREPLAVPGELVRPVDPLPDPMALRLLAERGASARPGFRIDEDERTAEAAREICRRLDGLPLAIELAAARLRMLTPRQIADRLDDRFRLLTNGSRTVLPRQQTLRAVVDWSWDLLEAPERAVLRRLAAFAGGCDLSAAEEVCGASPTDGAVSTGPADGPGGPAAADGQQGAPAGAEGRTGGPAAVAFGPDGRAGAGTDGPPRPAEPSPPASPPDASGAVPGQPASASPSHPPAPAGPADGPGTPARVDGQPGTPAAVASGPDGRAGAGADGSTRPAEQSPPASPPDAPGAAPGQPSVPVPVVGREDVAAYLGSLIDKSLVVAAPAPDGAMRYRLLETVGEYAGERLDESGERAAVERRHLVHYRELARTTDPLLRGHGQRDAIARLQLEYENLRTALRRAVALRDEQEALCLVLSLSWYWQMRDLRSEARHWSQAVADLGPDPFAPPVAPAPPIHERCTDAPPPMRPELHLEARRQVRLVGMVSMDHHLEEWTTPDKRAWLRAVVSVYRPDLPQSTRHPGSLWFFASLLTGDGEDLRNVLDDVVRAVEKTGHAWDLATALQMRANILANRSQWAGDAHRDADRSYAIYERLGDSWGTAEALSARGEAFERRGDYAEAAEDFKVAIVHAQRLGAQSQVSLLRSRLASVLMETGHGEEGEAILREVIAGGPEGGHEAMPAARLYIAMRLGRTGRIAEAREQLGLLREEFRSETLAVFEGIVLGCLAWLDTVDGHGARALDRARRALALALAPISMMIAPQLPASHVLTAALALTAIGGEDRVRHAVRLLGAYEQLLPAGHFAPSLERESREEVEQAARALLGDAAYECAYEAARAESDGRTLEEAVALV